MNRAVGDLRQPKPFARRAGSFCTYLTTYSGSHLPPFYIGHSSVEKVLLGYRGSVSSRKYREAWKRELADNPHLFKTRILTLHETREQAIEREVKFQKTLRVVPNPLYINQADSKPRLLEKHSPETIQKMRSPCQNRRGPRRPLSEEHRQKISQKMLGNKNNFGKKPGSGLPIRKGRYA